MNRYEDFDDLRARAPAAYRARIAIDLVHADAERLAAVWDVTADGEFRLALTDAVAAFWDDEIRRRGDVPEDHFAMEVTVDSYADPEMGHSLFLEGVAYCGSDKVGGLCWDMFADDRLERRFAARLQERVGELLARREDTAGLDCAVEVTEVAEL